LRRFRLNEISESYSSVLVLMKDFDELEENIVKYLKSEFERYTPQGSLSQDLKATHYQDIFCIEKGLQYDSYLSPHVYFMVYFMEGFTVLI